MDALSCIDQCFIADDMLEQLPAPSQVGKTKVGGIDLNKPRMRWVVEAVIALVAVTRWVHGFRAGRSGPGAQQAKPIATMVPVAPPMI